MATIVVKQVKSLIACPDAQRKVVRALGLGRIGKTKELNDTPAIRGMVNKVSHLVQIVD